MFPLMCKPSVSVEGNEGVSATGVASTPSSFWGIASTAALVELELATALNAVAQHAISELGAESIRKRIPSNDGDWIRDELETVAELKNLLAS